MTDRYECLYHRASFTIRTYAKKFALRHAQDERWMKRQHHQPFVVSLSNHVA